MTALAIGVFDGVHLGHQQILQKLCSFGCPACVITFSNHPSQILKNISPKILTSTPLKRAILEKFVDETIVIKFSQKIADLSFEEFLAPYAISHLVIGENATLGKNCLGTPDALRILGLERGFAVHVLPKYRSISSREIRILIDAGRLNEAENLLGRPHSFYYSPDAPADNLALPPDGEYPAWAGESQISLIIKNRRPANLKTPGLVSFGPNINPIIANLCLSHAVS